MDKIYLISEKQLRAESLINDNVDGVYINAAILSAQNIDLQEVVGTGLYNDICTKVVNKTITDEWEILLEQYIHPYLINRVMANIAIPLQFKFRNAGIVTNNDQHFQTASLTETEFVQNYYEHQAVFFANRIIEYVLNNKDVFCINCCDEHWVKFSKNTTKAPIYFRK